MYSNIIVRYDGSDESRDALSLASALRARGGLVTAVCLSGGLGGPCDERTLAPLSKRFARVDWLRTRLMTPAGDAVRDLHRHVRESGADLLVLGSSRRDELGMTFTRSAGRALLYGCPCPVAVVPRRFRTRAAGPQVVAVAFEDEDEALHAVGEAVRLTESTSAELRLLCLAQPLAAWALEAGCEAGYRPSEIERHHLRPFAHVLELALDAIPSAVQVDARMLEGPPASTLLRELQRGVDLVVMASPGARPIPSVRPGATALAAMDLSPCPVLLTPTGSRQTAPQVA